MEEYAPVVPFSLRCGNVFEFRAIVVHKLPAPLVAIGGRIGCLAIPHEEPHSLSQFQIVKLAMGLVYSPYTSQQHAALCAGVNGVGERGFGYTSWATAALLGSWPKNPHTRWVKGISLGYCAFVMRFHWDSDCSL